MQPSDVKAAIRARKCGWFDTKNGARGWIAGPFICLWFSAFDRHGPMLLGKISEVGTSTRISGRAGSDLNGLIIFIALLPLMPLFLYDSIQAGDFTLTSLFVLSYLLVFWLSHRDRREAEPLVRFLKEAASAPGRSG
jgi:hypothetical protein